MLAGVQQSPVRRGGSRNSTARSLSRETSLLSFGASQRKSDGAPHRVTTGAGDENRTRRSQLGNECPLIFSGFQRTAADEPSSSDELSGQLRTLMDEGECANFGPGREVKANLPSAVVGALENAATVPGVSLETLVVRIITQGHGPGAGDGSGCIE